mgnify:CR=1 FL=1
MQIVGALLVLSLLITPAAAAAQVTAVSAQLAQQKANVGWTKILSPVDGVVTELHVGPGDQVETRQVLAVVEEPS